MEKIKLCVVVTDSINLWSLYRNQFEFLKQHGFDVTAVSSNGPEHNDLKDRGVNSVQISMKRGPSIFFDIISFFKLWFFFILNRFDVVSVSTPKAALLASLAAKAALQPKVSFMVRGRAYENMRGVKRGLYEFVDKVICKFSDSVLSISEEIRSDFITKGICQDYKISVLGSGSSNGVDLNRFSRSKGLSDFRFRFRSSLGIEDEDVVFLYSGRIRRDKGVVELVDAFKIVNSKFRNSYLVIQGKIDSLDQVPQRIIDIIDNEPNIISIGWCKDVEKYFAASDVFVFPSHREGFGNVAIEASAMSLPVIAFDVIGCRESVADGVSGILVNEISSYSLSQAMIELHSGTNYRRELGQKGRKRVEELFSSKTVWDNLKTYYSALAGK